MNKERNRDKKGDVVSLEPMKVKMIGYEVVEKRAQKSGTSARIYVPKSWIGKLVRAVLIEK